MIQNKYDIIIIGGGTAGISCAWNSAKKGLKTLLIEKNTYLGGSITSSLVIPAMKTSENAINNDFYKTLYEKLRENDGAITYNDGNNGWFNPELVKITLDMLFKELNIDVLYEHTVDDIKTNNNKVLSVSIKSIYDDNNFLSNNKILSSYIETNYLVDATGDAKICQKLNCNFIKNKENIFQPMSLRFLLSGVNFKKFTDWLLEYDADRNVSTVSYNDDCIHFSTAYTWDTDKNWALAPLFKEAIEKKELEAEDCNYFQLFSVAGTQDTVAFNAPRLIDNNITTSEQYTKARLSILRLRDFCRKYLPGFENSHISSIANSLGVRVSNLVEGEYIYTYEDLITGKTFKNPVLISNYPVDIHSNKQGKSVLETVYKEYQLPLESLVVKGYKNLFVIGRCISVDYKAQAALRIIPSCFSMGEGLAKYLANQK